jgi:hypothetical protein
MPSKFQLFSSFSRFRIRAKKKEGRFTHGGQCAGGEHDGSACFGQRLESYGGIQAEQENLVHILDIIADNGPCFFFFLRAKCVPQVINSSHFVFSGGNLSKTGLTEFRMAPIGNQPVILNGAFDWIEDCLQHEKESWRKEE